MDKKSAVKIFANEFLNAKDEQIEAEIDKVSSLLKFNAKEIIFMEGDQADKMYYIVSGSVKISKISEDGKETIIYFSETGEIFAAVAAIEKNTYPVNATAAKKTELLSISVSAINKLSEQKSDFIMKLFLYTTHRIKYLLEVIDGLTSKDARGRLESYLKKLSEKASEKGTDKFKLPLAKHELALLLGATPETISRLFTKLKDEGLLEESGNYIKYKPHD